MKKIISVVAIFCIVLSLVCTAAAQENVPVDETVEYTELSSGSSGDDVINLQSRLLELYYYKAAYNGTKDADVIAGIVTGEYDEETVEAVIVFQEMNALKANGVADQATLQALYNEKAKSQVWVWVTKKGKKYHDNPNCSNMKAPILLTIHDAVSKGYEPCKKCY